MIRRRMLLVGILVGTSSGAEGAIHLKVGAETSQGVGIARGGFCDDAGVVALAIKNKNETENEVTFTGLKVGTTACKVGSDLAGPRFVFTLTVTK